jgi:MinD superfamily P-loop ATPase
MKELLVLSGKGGTGKTSLTASFVYLAGNCIACDYDVDASNLPILLHPDNAQGQEFSAGLTAVLDQGKCIDCGLCRDLCRFDAISSEYQIMTLSCEGCGFCAEVCPVEAIKMQDRSSGRWFSSTAEINGKTIPLFYAELRPGEENSGKLVAQVKNEARRKGREGGYPLLISDGSPGIGCPVISSLVEANLAVIVTEPSVSGFHDLERVQELLAIRGVSSILVINKADLNPEAADDMEKWAGDNNIPCAGRLPYSRQLADQVSAGRVPVIQKELYELILPVWKKIRATLDGMN